MNNYYTGIKSYTFNTQRANNISNSKRKAKKVAARAGKRSEKLAWKIELAQYF